MSGIHSLWLQDRPERPGTISWATAQRLSIFLYFLCSLHGIQGIEVILTVDKKQAMILAREID